jgi:hypothetical protein
MPLNTALNWIKKAQNDLLTPDLKDTEEARQAADEVFLWIKDRLPELFK